MSGANRIRRITKDQLNLRASPPLDYLFFDSPTSSNSSSLNEDITTVDVFLLGPVATAYENGVFRVSLKLGSTYPNEPPTASFRTKIFHPNINESNGDVCVDTLKNGWTSALNLVDVLSTIRCLLIHPNPSSALNSEAALLADTDYKAFEKQAKLFTKIYAAVSPEMKTAVKEAREARSKGQGEGTAAAGSSKAKRPAHKADRSVSMPTPARNPSSSSEEKKAIAAAVATPAPSVPEDKDGEKEKEGEEPKTDDSGKENTTSGHANNAAATPTNATTTTPKRPVSKKRSSDAVFGKPTISRTTSATNPATKKRSEPSSNGAPAPVAKKVLRSDTRKLSRENSAGSIGKGRSVSSGARKGLKRL